MRQRRLLASFMLFWWTLGLGLLYLSVLTASEGLRPGPSGPGRHAIIIGGLEAIAAILFLIPRTLTLGTIGLLATIGAAAVVHATMGQIPVSLLIDAAAVWFVFAHGPVSATQWRESKALPR